MTTALIIAAVALMLTGIAGTVIPLIPGAPLIFLGTLLLAWAENFEHIGGWTIALTGLGCLVVMIIDFVASSLGASKFGAGKAAAIGAFAGTIIGLFFAPLGIIFGPFIGAVLAELAVGREISEAGKAGFGTWIGLVLGTAFKVALCFLMVSYVAFIRLL